MTQKPNTRAQSQTSQLTIANSDFYELKHSVDFLSAKVDEWSKSQSEITQILRTVTVLQNELKRKDEHIAHL